MSNIIKEQSIKKLEMLFTVVDRSKAEFYLGVLSQFRINSQFVVAGLGTATSDLVDLLGLNRHKSVIISIASEEVIKTALKTLEEKFDSVRNAKGIAFSVPMASVIGVNVYQFLTDNRLGKE